MSTCEKCWRDAHRFVDAGFHGPRFSVPEEYRRLMKERKDNSCTPEQQAGPDATLCPKCGRKTQHQHTQECMACGHWPTDAPRID